MHIVDVVRLRCVNCGASEFYARTEQVLSIGDLHKCRGSVNETFTGPREREVECA